MSDFLIPEFSRGMMALFPYLVVGGGALLVILVDKTVRTIQKDYLSYLVIFALVLAMVTQIQSDNRPQYLLDGMMVTNLFTAFFNHFFFGIAVMTVIFTSGIYDRDGHYRPEFYSMILLSCLGMMVLVAANDLLIVFLGLETMSLAIYVMAGGVRGNVRSTEAGLKFLLLGGFSSAFLLMGMALLYGMAGATGFGEISNVLVRGGYDTMLLTAGTSLLLVGLGFKVALVPFHMWAPDVYEGAPAQISGYMASAMVAATMGILLRLALLLEPELGYHWFPVLSLLAVLTMSVGNLMALLQGNVKRLLAWSSIAHTGFLMLGFLTFISSASGSTELAMRTNELQSLAGPAILFYLTGFGLMYLAAFGMVGILGDSEGGEGEQLHRYAGLGRKQPLVALILTITMFSLAGIPPLVGFMAKFYVLQALVQAGFLPLAIIGTINSLVSTYYHLRLPVLMYLHPPGDETYAGREWVSVATASVLAVLIVVLGLMPQGFHLKTEVIFRNLIF